MAITTTGTDLNPADANVGNTGGLKVSPDTYTTLADLIEPNKPDATTAIFADPPRECPISAAAKSVKYSDPPDRSNTCPKKINMTTTVKIMVRGVPNNALVSMPR